LITDRPGSFTIAICSLGTSHEPSLDIHLAKLAAAAAAARSGLPLAPRCPVLTLVKVDVDEEVNVAIAACDARLAVRPGCVAFILDCLRCCDSLLGELVAESGCLTAMPCLKLVAGGCGRGLAAPGAFAELTRLTGELATVAICPFRALLILTPVMNSWIEAS
jgi:hypothetical protein